MPGCVVAFRLEVTLLGLPGSLLVEVFSVERLGLARWSRSDCPTLAVWSRVSSCPPLTCGTVQSVSQSVSSTTHTHTTWAFTPDIYTIWGAFMAFI